MNLIRKIKDKKWDKKLDEGKLIFTNNLFLQLKSAIDIDVGNYILDNYEKFIINTFEPLYFEGDGSCSFNVFINDTRKITVNEYDYEDYPDELLIGHYHSSDLLWLTLHYKEEVKRMCDEIDAYFRDNYEKFR